ncbi:MAG: aldo/keto reductase [Promethearchaeota archaeon]|nr:MAG: aldo/keto reductase [Candidatus Lokiarchaeota archaeon]
MCANHKGTQKYKEKMREGGITHSNHFRVFEDLTLSSIGMGTYLGNLDSKTDYLIENAVISSVNNGINVIDTSINYRMQKSERAIGKSLKTLEDNGFNRNQIFISTKAGYIPGDADLGMDPQKFISDIVLAKNLASRVDIRGHNCMTPKYLGYMFEQSLANLGLDHLDLLYLHNVAESHKSKVDDKEFYEMLENAFRFLEGKIRENKLLFYGMATWECFRVDPVSSYYLNLKKVYDTANKAAEKVGNKQSSFKFVMLPYNLAMPEAHNQKVQNGKSFLSKAQELGIGIFTAVPLLQGKLLNHPQLREMTKKFGVKTKAQAALQFVRSYGEPIIAPLVGQKQPEHVKENLELVKIST